MKLRKRIAKPSDTVFTPQWVVDDTIAHFRPAGKCLDPCVGRGAFIRALPTGSDWCEIDDGRDFFDYDKRVDWIVGNPPYSIFSEWLAHSFSLADDIVYVIPINKPFNSFAMLESIYTFGGIREIRALGRGSLFGNGALFSTNWIGFAIGAVHFQRDYAGPILPSFCPKPQNSRPKL